MRTSAILLLPLALMSCGNEAPVAADSEKMDEVPMYDPSVPSVEVIRGLIGSWVDVLSPDTARFHEHWNDSTDNVLQGIGYVLSGEDSVRIEDLTITEIDGEYIYNARVRSQNNSEWIQFLLMPSDADTLRFYNPQHDFPQEIIYTRDGGAWNVTISNESGRSSQFRLEPDPEEV